MDGFADMMSVALNSQDTSWRGIYDKFFIKCNDVADKLNGFGRSLDIKEVYGSSVRWNI